MESTLQAGTALTAAGNSQQAASATRHPGQSALPTGEHGLQPQVDSISSAAEPTCDGAAQTGSTDVETSRESLFLRVAPIVAYCRYLTDMYWSASTCTSLRHDPALMTAQAHVGIGPTRRTALQAACYLRDAPACPSSACARCGCPPGKPSASCRVHGICPAGVYGGSGVHSEDAA